MSSPFCDKINPWVGLCCSQLWVSRTMRQCCCQPAVSEGGAEGARKRRQGRSIHWAGSKLPDELNEYRVIVGDWFKIDQHFLWGGWVRGIAEMNRRIGFARKRAEAGL